jgi:hypothetical protein
VVFFLVLFVLLDRLKNTGLSHAWQPVAPRPRRFHPPLSRRYVRAFSISSPRWA